MPGNPPIPFIQSTPPGWYDPHNWSPASVFVAGPSDWVNVTLSPYGADPTGTFDAAPAINAAIASLGSQGGTVYFPAGIYNLISGPVIISGNNVTLRGPGWGFAAQLVCGFTSLPSGGAGGVPGMVISGYTAINQDCNIYDLAIRGQSNPFSGHCIVWRTTSSRLENVLTQKPGATYDGLHISPGDLAGSITDVYGKFCYFQNNTAGTGASTTGYGMWNDGHMSDSVFVGMEGAGGPSNTLGGIIGLVDQGRNNRYIDTHFFGWNNGGIQLLGQNTTLTDGELESNGNGGVANLQIGNGVATVNRILIQGLKTYWNAAYSGTRAAVDISANGVTELKIADADLAWGAGATSEITLANVQNAIILGNNIRQGNDATLAPHFVLCTVSTGNARIQIAHNTSNTTGSGNAAIQMADAQRCKIAFNDILSASKIVEQSSGAGADNNIYYGNDVSVAGSATSITTTGTHSRATSNPGFNPVGLVASPPAVPASTVSTVNNTGTDCMVIVTTNALATSTAISISGSATGISSLAASAVLAPVRVLAGESITLTYAPGADAPTWVWFGD